MKQKKVKLIRDEIVLISKHGGWAHMKMFINELGTIWEKIELSIDQPFSLKEEPKERIWP